MAEAQQLVAPVPGRSLCRVAAQSATAAKTTNARTHTTKQQKQSDTAMSRVIDPATVEELSWSQMYNRFNCNPMLLDLRPGCFRIPRGASVKFRSNRRACG